MNSYLLFKSLHLISVISWMAGLLYLPRIFVYHSENLKNFNMSSIFKTMERKLYSRAIYYYDKALKFNETDAQIFFNISGAYFYTKQYEKAITALEKCLEMNPNFPNAKKMLENLLSQQR